MIFLRGYYEAPSYLASVVSTVSFPEFDWLNLKGRASVERRTLFSYDQDKKIPWQDLCYAKGILKKEGVTA
jgi:hypothetical protein